MEEILPPVIRLTKTYVTSRDVYASRNFKNKKNKSTKQMTMLIHSHHKRRTLLHLNHQMIFDFISFLIMLLLFRALLNSNSSILFFFKESNATRFPYLNISSDLALIKSTYC